MAWFEVENENELLIPDLSSEVYKNLLTVNNYVTKVLQAIHSRNYAFIDNYDRDESLIRGYLYLKPYDFYYMIDIELPCVVRISLSGAKDPYRNVWSERKVCYPTLGAIFLACREIFRHVSNSADALCEEAIGEDRGDDEKKDKKKGDFMKKNT
jgi:hypothetical protein